MNDLSSKKCVPCQGDIPPFDKGEIHKYLKKVDGWDVKSDSEGSFYLFKEFKFKNFKDSQIFVNKVSDISEKEVLEIKKICIISIQQISESISSTLIESISGDKLNESSIRATVEEVSKKNIGKYL